MSATKSLMLALRDAGLAIHVMEDAPHQGAIVAIDGYPRALRLYAWQVTDNGRASGNERPADERRIQVSRRDLIDVTSDAETVVLGWAEGFTADPLIVAFNPYGVAARVNAKLKAKAAGEAEDARVSDSQQFKQRLLQDAQSEGLAVGENQFGETVVAMKAAQFLVYLKDHKSKVHKSAEDDWDGPESASSSGWGEYPLDAVFVRTEARSVAEVVKRIGSKRYVLDPEFQRDFVWPDQKQSKLIESCVMRIPLPVFYVAEARDGRIIVVDGLQRLTTFARYLSDQFALKDLAGNDRSGRPHPLEGMKFSDLPLNLQERIQDAQLTMYILDAKAPERARLDIFERVNSGEPLTRQQMRNALYNGPATQWLKHAASSESFQVATGRALNDKTMRDREAINRFCAFKLLGYQDYTSGDMDDFLGRGLTELGAQPESARRELLDSFIESMRLNHRLFGVHAFRKSLGYAAAGASRSVINISLFEVCSVLLSKKDVLHASERVHETIKRSIANLLKDEYFIRSVTYSTNSTSAVRFRFEGLRYVVDAALAEHDT